jgi:hypothetical protein
MLARGDLQIDAEQYSSGQASIWRKVYEIFQCRGRPCNKGPYCWCDPIGEKHYKLNSSTMEELVDYVLDGNTLKTYDDVPQDIRQQLYEEEEKSLEMHKKKTATPAANLPTLPITITVLPASSDQASHLVTSHARLPAPAITSNSTPLDRLNIPGFLDEHVEEYCRWQQSRVKQPKQRWSIKMLAI